METFYCCHCYSSSTSAHPDCLQHTEKLCFSGMGPAAPDERDPHRLSPAVPPRYVPTYLPTIGDIIWIVVVFFENFDCMYITLQVVNVVYIKILK